MASDYDFLKELFNTALEPIKQSIVELKSDVKVLNDRLLANREKYAEDIHSLTLRIEKIEESIILIEPKSNICQTGFEKKINFVNEKVDFLKSELNIILLAAKNPRLTIAIILGLYLLSISNIVPSIIKTFVLK